MPWLKVDDGMPDHAKWAALESDPRVWAECMAVWTTLGCYCRRTLSDGYVDDVRIVRLTPLGSRAKARCDDMVRVGLMVRESGGYRFHDWLNYQSSRSELEEQREQKTRRQKRWRDARVDASTSVSRDATRDARVDPAPSHPIPSHPIQRSSSASDAPARSPAGILSADAESVREALSDAVKRHRGLAPPRDLTLGTGPSATVLDVARWCREEATRSGREVATVVRELADRWARARDGKGRWVPLGWLARDPTEWATAIASDVSVPETEAERDADVDDILRRCTWVPGQAEEVTHG